MDLNTAWTNEMAQALKRLDTSSTGTRQFREPRALSSALAIGTLQHRALDSLNRVDPWTPHLTYMYMCLDNNAFNFV